MKRIILITIVYFGLTCSLTAQVKEDTRSYYRIGAGLGIEGNYGLWALNLTNEFIYYASPRFSINPALTYFVSIADFDLRGNYWKPELNGDNINGFVSTLFTDLKFQYDIIKTTDDLRVGIGFGPSFQFGGEALHGGWVLNQFNEYQSIWYIERHRRLGYVTQVSFDWAGKLNRRNMIGISMHSFEGYWPYYLMVNYRFGFPL